MKLKSQWTLNTWSAEWFTDDKKINKFLWHWHQWSADYHSNNENKTAVAATPTAECEQTVRQAGQMTFTIQHLQLPPFDTDFFCLHCHTYYLSC